MENAVSPDSSTIDQPDANINNYLAAVNDPNANKSNDNNNVFSSLKKNKQKTNHPKVKSVLKNSKNDPLANHVHKHSILIPGADEKERTRQNVTNMRELFSELQSIDETILDLIIYTRRVASGSRKRYRRTKPSLGPTSSSRPSTTKIHSPNNVNKTTIRRKRMKKRNG